MRGTWLRNIKQIYYKSYFRCIKPNTVTYNIWKILLKKFVNQFPANFRSAASFNFIPSSVLFRKDHLNTFFAS